jgi:hypothetical protein
MTILTDDQDGPLVVVEDSELTYSEPRLEGRRRRHAGLTGAFRRSPRVDRRSPFARTPSRCSGEDTRGLFEPPVMTCIATRSFSLARVRKE